MHEELLVVTGTPVNGAITFFLLEFYLYVYFWPCWVFNAMWTLLRWPLPLPSIMFIKAVI